MRLLVFGGWGQLGTDLFEIGSQRGHEVVRPRHSDVDVTDGAGVEGVAHETEPGAIVNAAAFHKTEWCEDQPEQAFRVNAVGALNVGRAAASAKARCVFVSSDYVFDGARASGYAEDDPVAPVNVYGASKVAGELAVRMACPGWMVVRGSSMFGHAGSSGKGGNFVETMLAKAAAGEDIAVVDDLTFAPTSTRDMAERVIMLLERDAPPAVYHLANAGSCSWLEFARQIFDLAGVQANLLPRRSDQDRVRRPRSSILLDTRTAGLGLPPARSWEEALGRYLEGRTAALQG